MSSRGRLLVSLAIAEGERAVDNTSDGTNQSNQQGDSVKETPDDGLRQSGLTTDIGPAVETQIEGFGVYISNTKFKILVF